MLPRAPLQQGLSVLRPILRAVTPEPELSQTPTGGTPASSAALRQLFSAHYGQPIPPVVLALPMHRQPDALRHLLFTVQPTDFFRRRAATAREPCPGLGVSPFTGSVLSRARLGTDSRFHLVQDGFAACAPKPRRPDGKLRHRHRYWWWTDGAQYRGTRPPGAAGETSGFEAAWSLELTDTEVPAAAVRLRQRCPIDYPDFPTGRSFRWPHADGVKNRLLPVRRALHEALGNHCGICGNADITLVVDHDHNTGRVRGLLCERCNNCVDWCLHADGCPFADYLNAPPAQNLQLLHPKKTAPHYPKQIRELFTVYGIDA